MHANLESVFLILISLSPRPVKGWRKCWSGRYFRWRWWEFRWSKPSGENLLREKICVLFDLFIHLVHFLCCPYFLKITYINCIVFYCRMTKFLWVAFFQMIIFLVLIMILVWLLQLELNAFRAQWMSELKPSSGASGANHRLLRAKGWKKSQEIAREEKVSRSMMYIV